MDQQHNEMDQRGSVEGVDSGNGSEFQGQFGERIYLRINWEIDQVKTLKVTSRFTVWVFCVHYNVDNSPRNSKKNMGEAVVFMEKIMSIFNVAFFYIMLPSFCIYNSN